MKRVIILTICALAAVSCVIDEGHDRGNRTGYNLLTFSENLLDEYVKTPIDDLSYLLVLDEFLSLPEEQQNSPEWAMFRSGIESSGKNIMNIHSRGFVVNTGGMPLTTPGCHWTVISHQSYVHSWNSGYDYYWEDNNIKYESKEISKIVTCTADGEYEITDDKEGKEAMQLSVEAVPSPVGGYDFTCTGTGKIAENSRGLSASYRLSEFYYKRYKVTEDGTGNSSVTVSYSIESMGFRVETFNSGQPLDWCEIARLETGEMKVGCNLEFGGYSPAYE